MVNSKAIRKPKQKTTKATSAIPSITALALANATVATTTTAAAAAGTVADLAAPFSAIAATPAAVSTVMTGRLRQKRLSSMSDEEIIQENLKEILDKQSREERKANGRLVAVIVAFLVIFLAGYHMYHASKRKPAALAGVLVPAVIMLTYGAWIVLLAKRDRHKRAMFERHIEEVARKNKSELEEKAARFKQKNLKNEKRSTKTTTLHFENEMNTFNEQQRQKEKQKQRRNKLHNTSIIGVHLNRRPSIREKLFGTGSGVPHTKLRDEQSNAPTINDAEQKRKRLQRMNTLAMPQVVRMSSAP